MFKVWAIDTCLLWTLYKMNFPGSSICPLPILRGWLFLSQISLCREYSLPGNLVILLGSRWLQEPCYYHRGPRSAKGMMTWRRGTVECVLWKGLFGLRNWRQHHDWSGIGPWILGILADISQSLSNSPKAEIKQAFTGNVEISWEFFIPQIC